MTITLADLATSQLNVLAETSPTLVGSVRFALDGNPITKPRPTRLRTA
jgi:hypothetical protein